MSKGHHPVSPWEDQDNCGNPTHRFSGLTKRELFALEFAKGLAPRFINYPNIEGVREYEKIITESGCILADALIEALDRTEKSHE